MDIDAVKESPQPIKPNIQRMKKSYILKSDIRQTRDSKMNAQKPEKKLVSITVAIALGIICIVLVVLLMEANINYNSILNSKDSTISSQISQISSLNNTIRSQNNTIATQNTTINRLNKLENLTNQIFHMRNVYDSGGNWLGSWNLVATFNENTVSGGKTPNFQIYNRFHFWRLNYTVKQNLILNIIQVNGSGGIAMYQYQFTYSGEVDRGSLYFFADSVYYPLSYCIEFPTGSFAGNWTMTVEQLQ